MSTLTTKKLIGLKVVLSQEVSISEENFNSFLDRVEDRGIDIIEFLSYCTQREGYDLEQVTEIQTVEDYHE